jgi:hypothetical protein
MEIEEKYFNIVKREQDQNIYTTFLAFTRKRKVTEEDRLTELTLWKHLLDS